MKISDVLKQLKMIEPDAGYAEHSKRAIMASPLADPSLGRLTPRRIFLRIIETALAAGLGALLIIFITGGFSGTSLSPEAPFAAVNPNTLRAEAQAVDVQIKLANLVYQESTTTPAAAESTLLATSATSVIAIAPAAPSSTGATSTATSTNVSIDDTLKALSQ